MGNKTGRERREKKTGREGVWEEEEREIKDESKVFCS